MIYLGHFSLREAPFSITPDTDFFYPHEGAQASLNTLLVALRSGEGFLKVVGELGCGKTVLCRRVLHLLGGEFVTAYIPNPDMGPKDLLLALAGEFGIAVRTPVLRHQIMHDIYRFLLDQAHLNRPVLLCIDEAQAIPVATIESLRLLSNLETEKRKLLQIVLFGQPDLDHKLAHPDIRQLLQRITFSEFLGPMKPDRVPLYLEHRLMKAAADESTNTHIFSPRAARVITQASGGVPRLINILAHKCMLLAFGENETTINETHAHLAARDTEGIPTPKPWWRRMPWQTAHGPHHAHRRTKGVTL